MYFTIDGTKYSFVVVSEGEGNDFAFHIRAICKTTRRTSCINNLNTILSELGVNAYDDKFGDSMWEVTKKEAKRFFKISKEFLSDFTYLNYLERQLDFDRVAGEWANI
jgi:predicted small integral membrane protein